MGVAALVAAFGLSLVPGVLSRLLGDVAGLDGLPWTPLALLPWLALAGLPGGRSAQGPDARVAPAAVAAALLPALGLAAASDVAVGCEAWAVLRVGAWGLVLSVALSLAARRGGGLHALAWWLALPVAALLHAARALAGDGAPEGLLAMLGASPLVWPLEALDSLRAPVQGGPGVPLGPLAVVALLLVAGVRGRPSQGSSA